MKTGLQHAVLVFIVNILTTNEEKIKLIEIFNNLDQDGDGQLTKEDLKQGTIYDFTEIIWIKNRFSKGS